MKGEPELAHVNAVRALSAEVVQGAKSGHPGAPMGCAPMAHTLWSKIMSFNPANPKWANRDRFVLSNGHACALQYTMLHLTGYDLSLDDLKAFRQLDSKTPGHPECFATPGVEVCTGPLGQGLSNAVGMCIAEANLAANFNKPGMDIVDHFTYVICGDGCHQEGVTGEACSLAGHLGLGKLILLYDDNNITIDGSTDLSFSEDTGKRFEAYGWQVLTVEDGDGDLDGIEAAVAQAKANTKQPTMIKVKTTIGFGAAKQGSADVHGAPLGDADISAVKARWGLPAGQYEVAKDTYSFYDRKAQGAAAEAAWAAKFAAYAAAHPALAAEFERRAVGALPANWKECLPSYTVGDKAMATRQWSGAVLNACAEALPEMIGGSADLTPSNNTALKPSASGIDNGDFQGATPGGRYLRFGVREHAMAAISNGIFAHGGFIPFCATFLNFMGYAFGASRLSALSGFGVLYIMTHDSIGLGEDGPTHQPVEMMMQCRHMPNIFTMRPADGNEVAGCYGVAIERRQTPSVMCFSRQGLPVLAGSTAAKAALGAYAVDDCDGKPDLVLVGTGSEVSLCVKVKEAMAGKKVRVVSMPCWELFEEQPHAYRVALFAGGAPVISVEAGSTQAWAKYSHVQVGMETFGCSAPGGKAFEKFGFTVEQVQAKAETVMAFYKGREAPSLLDVPQFAPVAAGHF
jgi:transketolase